MMVTENKSATKSKALYMHGTGKPPTRLGLASKEEY